MKRTLQFVPGSLLTGLIVLVAMLLGAGDSEGLKTISPGAILFIIASWLGTTVLLFAVFRNDNPYP